MENKFMKFVNENKWFVVFLLIWLFIHVILLLSGYNKNGFWPFESYGRWGDGIDDYGFVEFFVYIALPLLIFAIIKLVGKDIREKIEENN